MPVLLALLPALVLAAPKAHNGPLPFTPATTVLKNGLTVVRVPFDSKGLVAYYTVVRVGSRNEVEPGHTGFAHFFEHMMFRGTARFPEGARGSLLGKLGFVENAFTSDDVTMYTISGPSQALETLVDVEADRFQHLEYSEPAFQTEAKAVLGEYNKNAANPALKIEEAVLGAAFKAHTYRHTTLGFYDDIVAMPSRYEYSKEFFKRWYTPDDCLIFVVGDFDDKQLMALVEKHYGGWKGKAAALKAPEEPKQTSLRTASVTWTSPTLPRLGLFWHSPASSTRSSEGAVATVLGEYLFGKTSPLYKQVVLEQQLAEHLAINADDHRDPNLFGVEVRLKDEARRGAVNAMIEKSIDTLVKGEVDEKRVAAIRDHLAFSVPMELDTPDHIALRLAFAAGVLGAPDALATQVKQLEKVTGKDLVAYAKKVLIESNQTLLVFTVEVKGGRP